MKIKIFYIFIIILFSFEASSTNVRVVDFQKIIENNDSLNLLYEQIDEDQKLHKINFKEEELILENEFKRIEKLDLILEPIEIEKEIENYNNELKIFNKKIEKYNLHYETQINNLRNKIINFILEILKNYSSDNNIDLILDSNNYIISNNNINITDIISEQLNKIKIETNFVKY